MIAGAQDFTTGLAPVLAAARLFPKGEAVVIDDCGHYPQFEMPSRFNFLLREWIAYTAKRDSPPPLRRVA